MYRLFTLITIILLQFCPTIYSAYTRNPHVDPQVWEELEPYFLPEDHPIKAQLDEIFITNHRVILDANSLVQAGFKAPKPGHKPTRPYVLKHPKLKSHLVKMFTDDNGVNEWELWVKRIKGAYYTQQCIYKHGYEKYFSVPKKWIYPLPAEPSPPNGFHRKNFILVVQNMKILKKDENKRTWKSMAVSPALLDALYIIVDEVGLADSLFVFNIPFSRIDGRISFIDTEDYHIWPVNYARMKQYLSPALQIYWDMLIENEGPMR